MTTGLKLIGLGLLILTLGACARGDPELMNIRQTEAGPDEFMILPGKPLETPPSYSELPQPNAAASNRADATPKADAVAVLGGNPGRLRLDGATPDTALLSQTDRFGREATIRQELAAADLAFRQTNRGLPLEQLANVNVYYRAYERQTLDRYAELERLRRLGIRTPAVPPEISDN